jgi:hypothetical protein
VQGLLLALRDRTFELPAPWLAAENRHDGGVSFRFVSANEIIRGDSGSPFVLESMRKVCGAEAFADELAASGTRN